MEIVYNVSCMFPHANLFEFASMGNELINERSSDDDTIESVMRDTIDVLVKNGLNKKNISVSTLDDLCVPHINLTILDNVPVAKLARCLRLITPTRDNYLKTLNLSDRYDVITFKSTRKLEA